MMKSFLSATALTTLALASLGNVAVAADMVTPIRAPGALPPSEASRWAGFYVGVSVGGVISNPNSTLFDSSCGEGDQVCLSPTGKGITPSANVSNDLGDNFEFTNVTIPNSLTNTPGATLDPTGSYQPRMDISLSGGYNVQMKNFVVGIDASFDYFIGNSAKTFSSGTTTSDYSTTIPTGDITYIVNGTTTTYGELSTWNKVSWVATVMPKIGVATDNQLFYVKGGLAYGRANLGMNGSFTSTTDYSYTEYYGNGSGTLTTTSNWSGNKTENRFGFALGGGIDFALTSNIALTTDLTYYNLGKMKVKATGTATTTDNCTGECGYFSTGSSNVTSSISHVMDGFIGKVGVAYKF